MNVSKFILFTKFLFNDDNLIRNLFNNQAYDNLAFKGMKDILSWLNKYYYIIRKKYSLLEINNTNKEFQDFLKLNKSYNIKYVSILDKDYPLKLFKLKDYPIIIYYIGDISLLNNDLCSIMGGMYPSPQAIQEEKKIINNLIDNHYTIISGMNLGVNKIVHEECFTHQTPSISVFSSGLNEVFPRNNLMTKIKILNNHGLVLSEYPIGTVTSGRTTSRKNLLELTLADQIIIIQANIYERMIDNLKDYIKLNNSNKIQVLEPCLICDGDSSGNEYLIKTLHQRVI